MQMYTHILYVYFIGVKIAPNGVQAIWYNLSPSHQTIHNGISFYIVLVIKLEERL